MPFEVHIVEKKWFGLTKRDLGYRPLGERQPVQVDVKRDPVDEVRGKFYQVIDPDHIEYGEFSGAVSVGKTTVVEGSKVRQDPFLRDRVIWSA